LHQNTSLGTFGQSLNEPYQIIDRFAFLRDPDFLAWALFGHPVNKDTHDNPEGL